MNKEDIAWDYLEPIEKAQLKWLHLIEEEEDD